MTILNIHAILPVSKANGFGKRGVVWFQGCKRNCPGCFNPDTHSQEPRLLFEPSALARLLTTEPGIEGVSISGGEPFEQPLGLLELIKEIRSQKTKVTDASYSILVFSGYHFEQIQEIQEGKEVLPAIDVLVAGPYKRGLAGFGGHASSSNQKIHFLSNRYSSSDLENLVPAEVIINSRGNLVFSGNFTRIPKDSAS